MPTPTADVTIRPVEGSRGRRRFIDVPYDFYPGRYPNWVPPLRRDVKATLDPSENAFFEHGDMQLFLAEDASGAAVGRVAGIVNGMHLRTYEDATGFFGFFECVDDYAVAEALLDAATTWLRGQGLERVRGPANPSLNDTAGLLVDGFDREPAILMPYNPPYHEDFLGRYGFERSMTMWAYYVHKKYCQFERLERGAELVKRRTPGLSVRSIDPDRFEEEARTIREIYNDAWAENWGFVPVTENEFLQLAEEMEQIVEPELVYFVEHEGRPVGFSIALPNINRALRHVEDGRLFRYGLPTGLITLLLRMTYGVYECRMPLMGVRQAYQGKGLDSLLVLATIQNGPPNGFDACEMSWVLDSNDRLKNHVESIGGVKDKEYAMFELGMGNGD
ncbi:MAG: N-acetyltransferase family protein [Salinibacter sp.]